MSSNDLQNIYRSAAATIELRLGSIGGVRTILDDIESRVLSENTDVKDNERLRLEPTMLSQRLAVPRQSVQKVIDELHLFNFVHVWVRAHCPATPTDDYSVIAETDDPAELRLALKDSCEYCGQVHERVPPHCIETFYAVHVDGRRDPFRLSRFFFRPSIRAGALPPTETDGRFSKCLTWIKSFFVSRAGTPARPSSADAAIELLASNRPTTQSLSPNELVWKLSRLLGIATVALILVGLITNQFCTPMTVAVVVGAMVVAEALIVFVLLRVVLAVPIVQLTLLSSGHAIAFALLSSSYAFELEFGEAKPFTFTAGTQDVNFGLAFLGVCAYGISTAGVLLYPASQKWGSH